MMTAAVAGYLAEQHVFNELMRRGVAIYKPLVHWGPNGMARLEDGQIIELEILSVGGAGGKDLGWFQIVDFKPRPDLFIICITFKDDSVDECWVLPSAVFHAYATGENSLHRIRDFKLDGGLVKYGAPLRELLSWFLHRWALIAEFPRYRRLGELDNVEATREALREQTFARKKETQKPERRVPQSRKPEREVAPPPPPESARSSDRPSWEDFAEDLPALAGG